MINMNDFKIPFLHTRRSTEAHAPMTWLRSMARLWFVLALYLFVAPQAWAQSKTGFDHLTTGYALSGMHATARCESCHQGGMFKGTPRDCASCHSSGGRFAKGNVLMPVQHLPTTATCDSCHTTRIFSGARFSHAQVPSGSCQTCHNGSTATAKTANHMSTSASCDTCHATMAWLPAKAMDHSGFNAATYCASCHNGTTASGKSSGHIPVGAANCLSCHSTNRFKPSSWNHTQTVVTAQCATCHSGAYPPADAKPANHVPYTAVAVSASANCDSCHKPGYSSWANGKYHANFGVSSQCATCHTGSYLNATGKPATAVHAGVTNCENCHKTSGWAGAQVDHNTFSAATNCASCHNGSSATGKPSGHMPVGATNCISCHRTTAFKPSSWNHTQTVVTAQCATCHSGAYPPADAKPANHVPYTAVVVSASANCDSCHKPGYSSWANGKYHANFGVSSQCATCHTGSYLNATGKPATAIHAGVTNCESCHKTSGWAGATIDHSTFSVVTNCASCHNGSTATGKPSSHMPVGATNCISCHRTTAFKPSTWNHTQTIVTAQCATCHSGAYPPADAKPANHVPYAAVAVLVAANCDTCHKGSFITWANGKVHANASISMQCATCHTGSYLSATGRPANATHASIGATPCETCHKSTSTWSGATFAHSAINAVGTGTCDTCHNGSTAKGKTPGHIPITVVTAKCDACHKSQVSFATAVTMSHTAVTGMSCKLCHSGSYASQGSQGALAKPTNHIPEVQLLGGSALDCNSCHTSTTAWSSMRMNHNGSMGSGAGWCKACHQTGVSFLGSMERKSLAHEAKGTVPVDCSQSGCHRPLGNKGAAYTKWD